MKRVLVTGTSGFIGSRLAIRLAQAGCHVIATARTPSADLEKQLGLRVEPLDVLDPAIARRGIEADALIHCATANDIASRDFGTGVNLSVNGTRNVLELALHNGIREVQFLSTLQVYGTELEGEITEHTPPRCETPYALNHLLGEEVCRMYARVHPLDIDLVRPANVYGVPDASTVNRSTLVPMCFVKEALTTGKLCLRSSGRQQRNFVSTDEVADAALHLLAHPFGAGAHVVNVGSHWLASIRSIAEMVAAAYEQRTGTALPVEILSNAPERGNEFLLRSRLDSIVPPAAASAASMTHVIRRLFDHFQSTPSSP